MSKILVLEDDEMTMMLYREILKAEDHEVIEAKNSQQILENLDQKPELILMDMNFPGMSCDELVAKIRSEQEASNNPPIVVVSADEDIKRFSQELGLQGYLQKPFSIDEFLNVVETHTGLRN